MTKAFDMTVGTVPGLSTTGNHAGDFIASAATPLASPATPVEFIETPIKSFGRPQEPEVLPKAIIEPEVEAADQAAPEISPVDEAKMVESPQPPEPVVSPVGTGSPGQKPASSPDPDMNGGWKKAVFVLAIILLLAVGFLVKRGYDRQIAQEADALKTAKQETEQRLNAEISELRATGKLQRLTVSPGPSDVRDMLVRGVLTVENAANLRNGLTVRGDISASGNLTVTGIISAANLSGNGAGVVNVDALTLQGQPGSFYTNAANVSSGTLNDARLSPNVAFLSSNQTFGGLNTFLQGLSLQGNLAGTTGAFSGNVSGADAINVNEFVTLGQLTTVSAGNYFIQDGNSYGTTATLGTNDNFDLNLETNGTAKLTVTTAGNVGIGDTTPAALLTVGSGDLFQVNSSGAIAAVTGITASGGYTQSGAAANTFSGASSFTAAGTALSVTNNANIGGTLNVTGNTTLTGDLAVNGGDITSAAALNITPGGALTVGATGQTLALQGSATSITSTGAGNDITLSSADQIILNSTGTIELQDNTNITGTINGQTITSAANFTGTLAVTTLGSASTDTVLCRNGSNQLATCNSTFATTTNAFLQNGNSFGTAASLGTNDNFDLNLETNGTTKLTVTTAGSVGIGTATPAQKLDIAEGSLRLDSTSFASQTGIIYKGTNRFLHNFNYGNNGTVTTDGFNTFLGLNTGNFTMGSTATQAWHASYNTAVGQDTLLANTTGYENSALGVSALGSNTTGFKNTALGRLALYSNTTGFHNSALGYDAGRYIADGTTANQTSNTSLYLGNSTKSSANGNSNEIVIGYNTIGNGSNSVTLGNTSVTKTVLQGSVLIGPTVGRTVNTISPNLQVEGTAAASSALSLTRNTNDLNSPAIYLSKSRGTVNGGVTIVQNNDVLGTINFMGADGVDTNSFAASIRGEVDGTPGSDDMPGRLVFYTTQDGSASSSERMRITSGGNVGIGTTAPAQKLDITGGNLRLDTTSFASQTGIIYKDATRFLHNFNYGNNGTVTTNGQNTFLGLSAGNFTMGSTATAAFHASNNTGVGYNSLLFNTTGYGNSAIGVVALQNTSTGYLNSALGAEALYLNTTGHQNSALGFGALRENTTGHQNSAIGVDAGRYIADGTTANQTSNTSLYLGKSTKASANGNANEIVIGYNTTGNGTNSVTLGNTSITKTILQGSVGIGTTAPGYKLEVAGDMALQGGKSFYNTTVGTSSGFRIDESITNLATNPSVESNTTNWTAPFTANNTGAQDTTQSYVGKTSYKASRTATYSDTRMARYSYNSHPTGTYSMSVWVKVADTAIGTVSIGLEHCGAGAGSVSSSQDSGGVIGSWVRLSITYTITTSGNTCFNLNGGTNQTGAVYMDALQIEQKPYATSYADGSMGTGYAWTGTAHASTSTRTAGGFVANNTITSIQGGINANGVATFNGTGNNYFAGNTGIGTTAPAQKLQVSNGNLRFDQVAAPTAPTAAVNVTAGNLNGAYQYRVSYVTALGETETGTASSVVNPANQRVDLSAIPTSSDASVTARKIYRTTAGGSNLTMKLVATLNDNTTTTYTDNIADGSLGVSESRVNTTGGLIFNGTTRSGIIDNATTAIGVNALRVNTGYYNTAMGVNSLFNNTTGLQNSAFGSTALNANTTGNQNSALGSFALQNNTTGASNTAMGANALNANTTGLQNSAFGINTLSSNTTGNQNSALGSDAGRFIADGSTANQTSSSSVYLGFNTKASANGNSNEIVIGHTATGNGSNSVTLGNTSVTKTVLQGSVGIGTTAPAQKLDITGGNLRLDTTSFASQTGVIYKDATRFLHNFNYGNNGTVTTDGFNTFLGVSSGNFTMGSTATQVYHGSYNTGVGQNTLQANTIGYQNAAIGANALPNNTTGFQNVAIGAYALQNNTTGASNTAIGRTALSSITTGASNSAIGYNAGRFIADGATGNQTSGSSLYLGADTKASANGNANEIVIGYNTIGNGSNSVTLGNTSVTKTVLQGSVGIGETAPGARLQVNTGAAGTIGQIIKAAASQTADLLQAQDSTGAILAKITSVGNLEVKNATITGTLTVNGHVITANTTGTTTIAAGAAACTTPTVSISGNDTAGTITITTGTGCAGTGVLGTVTFAGAYAAAPRVVVSADNVNAAGLNVYTGSRATTTFTLDTATTPANSTTYTFNYWAAQ